jgi:hypothetical protein
MMWKLPCLSPQDKKEFWGARRRAVGGRSIDDGESSAASDDSEPDADEDLELPDVGGGRSGATRLPETSLQPVSYHAVPRIVMDSLHHALWGMSTIDMTPGTGDLCADNVLQNVGYVGICHTEAQKKYILEKLSVEIFGAMVDSQSKVYAPAYAKELLEQKKGVKNPAPEPIAGGEPPKKPKPDPASPAPAGGPPPTTQLSAALQQMLAAAKANA